MPDESKTTDGERAARREMGCHPRKPRGDPDDPIWCWCGHEIIMGIGQCDECQEAEDMSGYDY